MLAKNCSIQDLQTALDKINEKFDNNIRFNRLDQQGKNIRFTLTVNNSRGKGGRLGFQTNKDGNKKHICAACWHVHGGFFQKLLDVNPKSLIITRNSKIYQENGHTFGNWQDCNIGSVIYPLYFSEACDCGNEE